MRDRLPIRGRRWRAIRCDLLDAICEPKGWSLGGLLVVVANHEHASTQYAVSLNVDNETVSGAKAFVSWKKAPTKTRIADCSLVRLATWPVINGAPACFGVEPSRETQDVGDARTLRFFTNVISHTNK